MAEARGARPAASTFKRLLDQCLDEAGLSNRALHDRMLRATGVDLPVNTIDSWRRPHSSHGLPNVPREPPVQLAQWLCGLPDVTVTEEELLAAWRSDRAEQVAHRSERRVGSDDRDREGKPSRLARGEWYEGITDATIYLGMDTLLGRVEDRLRNLLNSGQPIPTYFAYLTHRGYLNWVTLTEDRRYGFYRAGVDLCETSAPEIAEAVVAHTGTAGIDLVSLGPGTGVKDRALVASLVGAVAPAGGDVYYYPYDINPAMIVHAIQCVLGGDASTKTLRVKGIIAPFDSLGLFSKVYKDRDSPNVLALLGNTLGNMSDDYSFLETLFTNGMWSGDLLLLEVRCYADTEAKRAPGIGEEAKMRFNFGPLEILGADYDDHHDLITIRRERSRSTIPNTVTTVTRCERVRCGPMTWHDVRLAYVHEYSEGGLDAAIGEIGYEVVRRFHRGMGGADDDQVVLLYVLRKP